MATRRESCSGCNALLQTPAEVLNISQLTATRTEWCSECNTLLQIPGLLLNTSQLSATRTERCIGCNALLQKPAQLLNVSQLRVIRTEWCSRCIAGLHRDPKAVNQAPQSGEPVQTIKKFDAVSDKKTTGPVVNDKILDEATEPGSLDRVSVEVRQAIQKARLEKKMSQAELAKQINERPRVAQDYENGKAIPNQAVLAKMERVLGVKLRGKVGK
ncbi:putative Multiprotein-bridging factor [Melia azedarach]|uniref:Multiprotein-bridging factor n=1 Tax=Melia azedarach TaxID=155640 RepID=A0ACC1WQN9_MELAZ|nr:putative Multiprotein-bridging factor [Melia azedarach]